MEGLKMRQTNRSAQDFIRQFGIDPFRKFLPDEKIKGIAKEVKKLRDRKFTIVSYFWLLVLVQLDNTIESIDELIRLKWLTLRKELGMSNKPVPVTKQSFSKRNTRTPVKILERLYQYVVNFSNEAIKTNLYQGLYLFPTGVSTSINIRYDDDRFSGSPY